MKKVAVGSGFQVRKVSGLHSATSMESRSSLSLFEQEILHLLREANNASRPSLPGLSA